MKAAILPSKLFYLSLHLKRYLSRLFASGIFPVIYIAAFFIIKLCCMLAAPNSVVKITYQLRTEPNGEIVDEATIESPFSFLFGHNNVLPKFEEHLKGKAAGSTFSFTLTPEEGYGLYEEDGLAQLPKDAFVWDGELQEDLLVLGNIIPLQDNHGNLMQGRIVDIQPDFVIVDLNHPLAGEDLYFSGTILEIREALPVEIEHGHVHDGGMHHP